MTVKQVCQEIHNLVEESGLHFSINQTPFSSYITLRKKFIKPEAGIYSDSEATDVVNPHLVSEQLQAENNNLSDLLAHREAENEALKEEAKQNESKFETMCTNFQAKERELKLQLSKQKTNIQNLSNTLDSKDLQISDFGILKQTLKTFQHDEKVHLKDVADLNKLAKLKDKEIYNLQKRIDNFVDTTNNLKEKAKELLEEKNAAEKHIKNVEKKFGKEKKRLETKVDILEKRLVRETKNVSVQTSTLSTSSTLDMNSNSHLENATKTPQHIAILTKPKKACPKGKLGRFQKHQNCKYPRVSRLGFLKSFEKSSPFSFPSVLNVPHTYSEYECPTCGKSFPEEWELRFHVVLECKKVTCAVCDKTFHSKEQFAEHIMGHNSEFARESQEARCDERKIYLQNLRNSIEKIFKPFKFS
jgi:predicted  nucleic acid-binding Zn-ribbon protein